MSATTISRGARAAAAFFLAASVATGAMAIDLGGLSVAPSRVPTWYPITSPVNTAGWTTYNVVDYGANPANQSGGPDQSALMAAINAANASGAPAIIYFPAGTYDLTGIPISRSNMMLAGAGRNETVIEFSGGSPTNLFGGIHGCPVAGWILLCGTAKPSNPRAIASGGVTGSSQVTVSSTSGYALGDWVELRSDFPAGVTESFQGGEDQVYSYHARITGISGNRVTFDRPLRENLHSNATMRKIHFIERVGLRNMQIKHDSPSNQLVLIIARWIVDASFTDSNIGPTWGSAMVMLYTSRTLIRGNDFGDQRKNTQWNKSQINLGGSNFDNVVENNSLDDAEVGIEVQQGASWNIVAYNYMTDATTIQTNFSPNGTRCERSVFFHGNYTRGNLVEGNDVHCTIHGDQFWGQQGPHNTIFRNRTRDSATGFGEHITNEVFTTSRQAMPESNYIANTTRSMGVSWGGGGIDRASPSMWIERNLVLDEIRVRASELGTTLVNNHIGNQAPGSWSSANIPASLYLEQRPTWWPTGKPWPAIGADVDRVSGPHTSLPAQDRFEGTASEGPGGPPAAPILLP